MAYWRLVLTWGVAHEEEDKLLPMRLDRHNAITQELLLVKCATRTKFATSGRRLRTAVGASGISCPLVSKKISSVWRWDLWVASHLALFQVGAHHMRDLLDLTWLMLTQRRNFFITERGSQA